MLPRIARLNSTVTRRCGWCLALAAVALFALPTWFVEAQTAVEDPAPAAIPAPEPVIPIEPDAQPVAKPVAGVQTPAQATVVEFLPQYSESELKIVDELDKPTTLDFTDESLDGARDTIMERHGFNIIIEKALLEEESVATDAADLSLKVHEIPLRSALKLLLQQKGLAFVIEDGVLKITTRGVYITQHSTRTYPVRDLVEDVGADSKSLIESIKLGVTPGAWVDAQAVSQAKPTNLNNSASTISMLPASGSLVIRQSWQGHDEVLKLLRALRQAKAEPTVRKLTRQDIPRPTAHMLIDVKHNPGIRVPAPVKHIQYTENHPEFSGPVVQE